jgi:hypothetical protein
MELSTEHQQKRRPSDSNTDYMTHKDNGQESDPTRGLVTRCQTSKLPTTVTPDTPWRCFATNFG